MPLITRSEAARALGVTPEAVYAAVKTGRLPVVRTADGRELVNSETMREHWAKNTQRRIEHLKAELLELDRKQKEGVLVKAEEVELKWVEIVTLARTKILGIPTKAKQRIPDLDTDAVSMLEDIVRETLEDLSESVGDE
jgi:excisionase family DNA binding protein